MEDHRYDDIINMEHPTSKKQPRMSEMDRAAQFAPFAALTGYEGIIAETGRLTSHKQEPDESSINEMNRTMDRIIEAINGRGTVPYVRITWFIQDRSKDGGSYRTVEGYAKKTDAAERTLTMADGTRIPFDDIIRLEMPK